MINSNIFKIGKCLLGIALLSIAFTTLAFKQLPIGFVPLSAVTAGNVFLVYIFGILLAISGLLLLIPGYSYEGGLLGEVIFLIVIILLDLPRVISKPLNPSIWTGLCEALSILSGLITILAVTGKKVYQRLIVAAKYIFVFCLFLFGVLHILFAKFILTLIPGWLPTHAFFNYLVIIGFLGSALVFTVRYKPVTAGILLSGMFGTWLLILHLPRAFANHQIEAEWTSAFIALGMSGVALLIGCVIHSSRQNQTGR